MIFLVQMGFHLSLQKLCNLLQIYNNEVEKEMYSFENAMKKRAQLIKEGKAKAYSDSEFLNFCKKEELQCESYFKESVFCFLKENRVELSQQLKTVINHLKVHPRIYAKIIDDDNIDILL